MRRTDSPNQFAERLQSLFEQTNLKTKYIALHVGITKAYLPRLRNGRATNPGFNVIQGLAEVFNVSPAYFFRKVVKKMPEFEDVGAHLSGLDKKSRIALMDMLQSICEQLETEQREE